MTYPYDISMLTCYKGRDSCIKRDLGGEVNYPSIFLDIKPKQMREHLSIFRRNHLFFSPPREPSESPGGESGFSERERQSGQSGATWRRARDSQ